MTAYVTIPGRDRRERREDSERGAALQAADVPRGDRRALYAKHGIDAGAQPRGRAAAGAERGGAAPARGPARPARRESPSSGSCTRRRLARAGPDLARHHRPLVHAGDRRPERARSRRATTSSTSSVASKSLPPGAQGSGVDALGATAPVIRVEDIHKYYDLGETRVHALRGVERRGRARRLRRRSWARAAAASRRS